MGDDAAAVRTDGVVRLAAKEIPPPVHVSDQARAVLAAPRPGADRPQGRGYPALDDKDGWRRLIAARDAENAAATAPFAARLKADVAAREMAGVPVYVGTPQGERLLGAPPRGVRHPRRRPDLRRRRGQRALRGGGDRPAHRPGHLRPRLPRAAGPPLPGGAGRLHRRLPRAPRRAASEPDRGQRHLRRRQPGRRPVAARPRRGPADAGRRAVADAGARPHRERRHLRHPDGPRCRAAGPADGDQPRLRRRCGPEATPTSRRCSATSPASRRPCCRRARATSSCPTR